MGKRAPAIALPATFYGILDHNASDRDCCRCALANWQRNRDLSQHAPLAPGRRARATGGRARRRRQRASRRCTPHCNALTGERHGHRNAASACSASSLRATCHANARATRADLDASGAIRSQHDDTHFRDHQQRLHDHVGTGKCRNLPAGASQLPPGGGRRGAAHPGCDALGSLTRALMRHVPASATQP